MAKPVFCFIPYSQLSLIKNQWLVFLSAAQLGDPFLENKKVYTKEVKAQRLSDKEFTQALRPVYDNMADHMKAMVSWEYYLEQAKKNRDKIESQLQAPTKSNTPLPKVDEYAHVCCLSVYQSLESMGLWQQQAEGFRSIALELDGDHDFFTAKQFANKPQMFAPVIYDDARPAQPTKQQPFPGLLAQPEHLAHERQSRLIRPESAVEKQNGHELLFRLPKGLLKGIYLGVDCPAGVAEELLKLKQTDLSFKSLPLWHMSVSETHLRLLAMPLDGR